MCSNAVASTVLTATGDASCEKTTNGGRVGQDGLAGAEGKDTESGLLARITEVEGEILARLDEYHSLLDRLSEERATPLPSPFTSIREHGCFGMEEHGIDAGTTANVPTRAATEDLDIRSLDQAVTTGAEVLTRSNETANPGASTKFAYDLPTEVGHDSSSSSVTLDHDEPAPTDHEIALTITTNTGRPAMVATNKAVDSDAPRNSDAVSGEQKLTKKKAKRYEKKCRQLYKKLHKSMKELDEQQCILQATLDNVLALEDSWKQSDKQSLDSETCSPEQVRGVTEFRSWCIDQHEHLDGYKPGLRRLYTPEFGWDSSLPTWLLDHAQKRLPEWSEGLHWVVWEQNAYKDKMNM
ncbi:hypothetical protein VPNG_08389 [Cytospora leucostoma]|uniref:Uncharacterized protein n=1 Tax=Cytospora leucostoma TaxID=1230097 RepID=A0A423W689_9PEZI|nr:hypothetical protein VPNG_08389 [Cytospora leucostoma]